MKQQKLTGYCIICMLLLVHHVFAQDIIQQIVPGRVNAAAQMDKPYIILISADGFRHDLADKYDARFLKQMREEGVQAKGMQPSYPSLTFPNHYAIITGLYPAHHGLVDNYFYDRHKQAYYKVGNNKAVRDSSWYGGEPLWVRAEKQGMLTASYYWVGSESHIDGVPPTYYYKYTEAIPIDRRIQTVKDWLSLPDSVKPHFITFYFPEVDHMEHLYGVDSKQAASAVHFVDSSLHALYTACNQTGLPINYVFVSDHGFANLDTDKTIQPPALDSNQYIMTGGSALVHIYAKQPQNTKQLRPLYQQLKANARHYSVYQTNKTPKSWHYRKRDDLYGRIGEILLVPDPPYSFYFGGRKMLGAHGFDNRLPDMQATFYAWGPAFKKHMTIDNFPNVDVYPLLAHLLGLSITKREQSKLDGRLKKLEPILK